MLKILPPELVADEERRRRFLLEAQAAAALKHPNIAVIYEVDEIATPTQVAAVSWSPDGDRISYAVGNGGYVSSLRVLNLASSAIWIASKDGCDARKLTEDAYLHHSPQWTLLPEDAERLYFILAEHESDVWMLELEDSAI